jgi:hypothetical protein
MRQEAIARENAVKTNITMAVAQMTEEIKGALS